MPASIPPPGPAGAPSAKTILVIDDEKNIRRTLQLVLEGDGYRVVSAETAATGLELATFADTPVDLVLLDIKLPDINGLEVLDRLKKDDASKHLPVIVISGHASVHDAVTAIKLGASDFFEKPLNRERVLVSVRNVLDAAKTRRALAEVERQQLERYEMIGRTPVMQKLFRDIEKVAPTKASVLITGESGTGKELISRAIHRLSPRNDGPFVRVNCAAMPQGLIESELFGHEKGAFTGAQARKRGLFEQAHGGTLFLDEVGDMDLSVQAKVLRALQAGEVSRVGAETTLHVDVRVLAATNKELTREVERGTFREDLYFRLNVFPIRSPALRERVDDLGPLVDAFLTGFARENGTRKKPMDELVLRALGERKWPGNIRELKNLVERMAILSGDRITIADLPEDPHESPFAEDEATETQDPAQDGSDELTADLPPRPNTSAPELVTTATTGEPLSLRDFREVAERWYIVNTLRHNGWNISRTANVLGVERTNLHKKIRAYSIKREP